MFEILETLETALTAVWISSAVCYLVTAISLFMMGKKANVRNPWVGFIPVLQIIVLLHVIDKSGWCILLLLIPVLNIILEIIWIAKLYAAFSVNPGLIVLSIIISPFGLVMLLVAGVSSKYTYAKSNRFEP